MKNIKVAILFVCAFFSSFLCFAQNKASEVQEFVLSNGIPVYYLKNTNNKVDNILVGIKGGTANYSPELSGIELAAVLMMGKGSSAYSHAQLQALKYQTSASVAANSGYYGSWVSLSTIDEYLDITLPMVLDGIVNPEFNREEFDKIKNDFSNSVQQTLNDPLSLADYYLEKLIYEDHPYAVSPQVTPDSLNNITYEAVRDYYATLLDSRRFYVIAVTRSDAEEILPVLEHFLGEVPESTEELIPPAEVLPAANLDHKPMVFTHPSISGSSHVFRVVQAPGITSEDYIPFVVAENIYQKTLYHVLREKYGSCYSVWATNGGNDANYGMEVLYRCSDMTDFKQHLEEARKIMADGKYITGTKADGSFIFADLESGFEGFRNSIINSTYSSEMTTAAKASTINSGLLLFGKPDGVEEQRSKLNSVTTEEVLRVFNKYFTADDGFYLAITGPENEEAALEELNK